LGFRPQEWFEQFPSRDAAVTKGGGVRVRSKGRIFKKRVRKKGGNRGE